MMSMMTKTIQHHTGEFDPIQGGLVVPATISLRDLYNEHDYENTA
jgi:hypothetical protein